MDLDALKSLARIRVEPAALAYQSATAGADPNRDEIAWRQIDVVPRVLRSLRQVDTSTRLLGAVVTTPVTVAATAGHRLSHPDGEIASGQAAARLGALFTYSSSASVEVTEFGAAVDGPWWAQVYVMKDFGLTSDYLDRLVAAGATAVVLTVDNPGTVGDAPFRARVQSRLPVTPGNYPGLTWAQMSAQIEPNLWLDHIGRLASMTGLPVVVKGVLHPGDAAAAVSAGAAAIVVSNHGRRQLDGVIPTALALPDVVRAVAGRVPVLVDGGLRSGTDVLRALATGAVAVGLGRPVLWALAAGGADGVADLLDGFTAELRQAMAAVGAATLGDLTPDLVRHPPR